MGMSAEVIAIGRFSQELRELMEYPPKQYASTKEGAVVSIRLFGIVEGSTVSRMLASHLGITDAWDFNQHKITNDKIDFAALNDFGKSHESYADDIKTLEKLVKAGFELHFRPEG